MWTSSAIPYISLFSHQQTHTFIFIFFSLYFPTFIFTLYVPCFLFFLIDHNQKQVLSIKWVIFSWSSKIFFCSSQLFENGHIHNVVLTLINVMKLGVEDNNIISTLSNVVNINVQRDKVDLTLSNVVNRYTLINTTLFQRWFDIVWCSEVIST